MALSGPEMNPILTHGPSPIVSAIHSLPGQPVVYPHPGGGIGFGNRPVDPGMPFHPGVNPGGPGQVVADIAHQNQIHQALNQVHQQDIQNLAQRMGGDEGHTHNVSQHLLAALQAAKDPQLKESLSNALAAIHKHLAGFQKEREQALQGKFSPRLLQEAQAAGGNPGSVVAQFVHNGSVPGAPGVPTITTPGGHIDQGYNPAQYQLAQGNTPQAVADWEAHHPAAMAGRAPVPAWVQNYIASLAQAIHPQAAAALTNSPAPGLAVS